MLCEIHQFGNFWFTWLFITLITTVVTALLSTPVFIYYYAYPTYEKWTRKSNPTYPTADKVRDEIIQTLKGVASAALCPAISLWLQQTGWSQGYCGVEPHGWMWLLVSFFIVWLGSDFYEFYYHRLGHMTNVGWLQHKYHHVFFNPTPFSVIADEYIDQFVRAMPLVLFPLILPINVDMMYVTFGVFFYGYGVALHCGHELDMISAHNYWINTPFQHYVHHAKSVYKKPYHTGFFIKVWDRMFGSLYEEKCVCAECARKEGKRGVEKWNKVKKIDYSPLLSWRFWKNPENFEQVQQMEADVAGDKKE